MKKYSFEMCIDEVVLLQMALEEYRQKTLERIENANDKDKDYFRDILSAIVQLDEKLK